MCSQPKPNISHCCCCQLLYTERKMTLSVVSCHHVSCSCMSGQPPKHSGHENLTKFQVRRAHYLLGEYYYMHASVHEINKAGSRHLLMHIRSAPYRLILHGSALIPANLNPHSRHMYHTPRAADMACHLGRRLLRGASRSGQR